MFVRTSSNWDHHIPMQLIDDNLWATQISFSEAGNNEIKFDATKDWRINFGDDNGAWSNDGECDDPRFSGPGMTTTALLDEDILHDATDCRIAFEAGLLSLN